MMRMPLLPRPWLVPLTSAGSLHSTCSWTLPNFSRVIRSPLPEHSKYPSLTGQVGSISLPALAPLGRGANAGKLIDPTWPVKDGYFECSGNGDLMTREKFGNVQLHVEWSEPADVKGTSQGRGNSGILIMSRYEIQVLDAFKNPTYADGQAGAIYGQWPPLANPSRPPGQWQAYDIVFEAPRFDGEKLVQPAFVTVFMNNVLMHNRKEMMGAMVYRKVATYAAHGAEEPLALQDHHNPVRYRNIWIRRLGHYLSLIHI